MVEGQQTVVVADAPEAVDVAIAEPAPVDKFDAEFEGSLGLLDELDLVDFENLIEQLEVRNRGFADAHDADLIRFNQADRMSVS